MIDGFELEGLETVLVNDVTGETKQSSPVELDAVEFGVRKTAPVEYYPIQKYNSGLIHYDYSVAQHQIELVGDRYSYFATPLYSNSSGLVGFGIATEGGKLDYVIDKGKFNDFTRNIDSYYLAADWGSAMTQDHIAYFEAIKNGDWGTAWSSGKNIVGAEYTFANLLSSASTIGGVSGATRGLMRNSVKGTTALRKVGSVLESVDDVMANPNLLQGQSYGYVRSILSKSQGWINGVMTKTRGTDKGWVLRQMNNRGQETGRLIQYHPGSRRHYGGAPYWKVSDGTSTFRFPAAN